MKRRLLLGASLAVLGGLSAQASPLPQDLKIIWGFPPGGAGDFIVRLIADHASKTLGRKVLVLNQAGATGLVAIEALRRAPPDGATISMVAMTSGVLMPMVNPRAKFDFMTDVESVAHAVSYSVGFAVANNTGVKDWPGFLAWAKQNPTKVMCGGSGQGGMAQLFSAMIKQEIGVDLQYVPYRGGADLNNAIMGGHLPFAIGVTSDFAEPHKTDRMRVLAVSSTERDQSLPDVRTFIELGYKDLQTEPWFAFFAPPGTPAPLLEAWNEAINAALKEPTIRERLIKTGFIVGGGSREDLRKRVAADKARWQPVVTMSGVKVE
jgi:tripartite-type tricarboxylate transporter receptor subunit TctC